MRNPWRDVKVVERLVELRGRGHSIPEVAQKLSEEFDVYLTRRAVVGKMRRLKLSCRDTPRNPSFNITLRGPIDHSSLANLHAAIGDWLKTDGQTPDPALEAPKRKRRQPSQAAQLTGAE